MAEPLMIITPVPTDARVGDFLPSRRIPDGLPARRRAVLRALGVDLRSKVHTCAVCAVPLVIRDGHIDFTLVTCSFREPGAWVGLVEYGICPDCTGRFRAADLHTRVHLRASAAGRRN